MPIRHDQSRIWSIGIVETHGRRRFGTVYEVDDSPILDDARRGEAISHTAVLAEQFARELNTPFSPPAMPADAVQRDPRELSGDHYVCVGYDHWVADSVASRLVLRHVLDRLPGPCDCPRIAARPVERYPGNPIARHFVGRLGRLSAWPGAHDRRLGTASHAAALRFAASPYSCGDAHGGRVAKVQRHGRRIPSIACGGFARLPTERDGARR